MEPVRQTYLVLVSLLIAIVASGSVGLFFVVSPGVRASSVLREEASELAALARIDQEFDRIVAISLAQRSGEDGLIDLTVLRDQVMDADLTVQRAFADLRSITDDLWVEKLAATWQAHTEAVASQAVAAPSAVDLRRVEELRIEFEDELSSIRQEELVHVRESVDALEAADRLLMIGLPTVAGSAFAAAAALIWYGVTSRRAAVEALRRRTRYTEAVADCAQILLRGTDDKALVEALSRLLPVTRSESVFLERNVVNDAGELGTTLVAEVLEDGTRPDPSGHWEFVPWSALPEARKALEAGQPYTIHVGSLGGDAAAMYAHTEISSELNIPVFSSGEWVGLIGFAQDSRELEWRDDEVALLQTLAEIVGAFWQRLDVLARLEQLVVAKDDFLASVSHELRTPLAVVVGLAHEMAERPDSFTPAEVSDLSALIAQHSAEVSALVDDLLVAARADIDRITFAPETVDLVAETEAVADEVFRRPEDSIVIDGERGLHLVVADAMRVRQIIRNLAVNATKYGGPDIRMEVDRDGRFARVTVADNGVAIAAEDRDRIFDRYARAHAAPSQPVSLGLGLHVARTLVEKMGGSLAYEHDGKYSRFEVRLPLATDAPDLSGRTVAAGV